MVDVGQRVERKLHVHHGTGDGDDAPLLQAPLAGPSCFLDSDRHLVLPSVISATCDHSSHPLTRFPFASLWPGSSPDNTTAQRTPPVDHHVRLAARRASAPPTISMISVVIASWRARFMILDNVRISSSAFSVAAAIARWRAACSEADASSIAEKSSDSSTWGASVARSCAESGSNSV